MVKFVKHFITFFRKKIYYIRRTKFMEVALMSKETKDIRVVIMFDYDLLTRVDDYRYGNRIASRGEAIRILVEKGLKNGTPKKQ